MHAVAVLVSSLEGSSQVHYKSPWLVKLRGSRVGQ